MFSSSASIDCNTVSGSQRVQNRESHKEKVIGWRKIHIFKKEKEMCTHESTA